MEEIVRKNILDLLCTDELSILLIDVFDDKIVKYEYANGVFNEVNKKDLTTYLEQIKEEISQDKVKDYMNLISIPKLEQEKTNGNNVLSLEYEKINGDVFCDSVTLVETKDKKIILMLREKRPEKIEQMGVIDEAKYNVLVETLSDVILKIQNIFSIDKNNLRNINNVEEYINSIFSGLISNYPELKHEFNKTVANVTGRKEDTLLIVDDSKMTRTMLSKVFDKEYKIVSVENGKEAISYLEENSKKGFDSTSDHIVGIFLDLVMPVLDGFGVLDYLSNKSYLNRIPVIIISGDYEKETKTKVYNYNIADMLEKPFDFEIVKHRVKNFVNLYKSSNSLYDLVSDQNNDLKELINPFVESYLLDYDQNIKNISKYFEIIANDLKENQSDLGLDAFKISKMVEAIKYYDLGFYSLPRSIVSKKEKHTDEEIEMIKKYPIFGSKMLEYVLSSYGDKSLSIYANNITTNYHENYDGSGYPMGLKGDEIPLEAQIASICISYNSLKKKKGALAKEEILSKKGTKFNPIIVDSFSNVYDELEEVE